jgi:hypothetical protein
MEEKRREARYDMMFQSSRPTVTQALSCAYT